MVISAAMPKACAMRFMFFSLFGGDAAAMAIVGIATLCGYYIKAVLVERGIDIRAVFIICADMSMNRNEWAAAAITAQ